MSVSLDGRVAGPDGSLQWAATDDEAHRVINDELSEMSGFLLGRRTYEMLQLAFGQAADQAPGAEESEVSFAQIWRSKPKHVFSRTLERVDDMSTLSRDVSREGVERMKTTAGGDLSVGGPCLAAALIQLGLVDEFRMYVFPVVLGGGLTYMPAVRRPLDLRLISARALTSGVVRLAYTV